MKTYTNIGTTRLFGAEPGKTFRADLTKAEERRLYRAGAIANPVKPKKKRKKNG